MFEESERKEASLKKILKLIGLSEENANDIIEYCYDIIMYVLRAKLYSEGLKSSGKSAHEAEVSYFKEIGFSDADTNFLDEARYLRNGVKYYGRRLSKEYAEKVVSFMDKVLPSLKKSVNEKIKS